VVLFLSSKVKVTGSVNYFRILESCWNRDASAFARLRYQSSAVFRMLSACFINTR